MSWECEMVRLLLEQRQMGVTDFALAWRRAQALSSFPRPRDFYARRPLDDPDWRPFSTFFRDACAREWRGLVKADFIGLRALFEDGGDSRPAQRPHESGAARVVLLG